MGVRAARRAFFSYTTEPEGSYSIHRVFIRFLEVNRMDMGQAEKPKAAAFLTDYILLRIYVAKYVLAGYNPYGYGPGGEAEGGRFPYGLYPAPYLCGEVCPCRI